MNVNEILQDPEFQGMPIEERRKVILSVDPEFGKLGTGEQDRVLNWYVKAQTPQGPGMLQQMGQVALGTAEKIGTGYAPAETALNLLTSIYGQPASGLAGLGGAAAGTIANIFSPREGRALDWASKAQEAVRKATVYEPQTQAGQELTQTVGLPFQKVAEAGQGAANWVGEQLSPEHPTAGPIIAATVGTVIEASPMLIGIRKQFRGSKPTLDLKNETARMQRDMVKEGYPIGKGTKIERFTEVLPPGNEFWKKWRSTLNDMVNRANKQFVTEELGLPDPTSGPKLKAQMMEIFDDIKNAVGGNNAQVAAPNLLKWINENLDTAKFTNKQVAEVLSQLRKDLSSDTGMTKFYNLNNLQYWLSRKFKPTPLELEMYGGVKEALKADLDLLGQTMGKDIKGMYETAMEKARQGHRVNESKYVEALIRRATRYDPDRMIQIFDPIRFREIVSSQMENLNNMFRKQPEIPRMIDAYANKLMGAARDLQKFSQQKPMTPGEWVGTAAGLYGASVTGLIVPWGFETWMAHSLAHPRGWLKSWVFSGEKAPALFPGSNVAIGAQVPGAEETYEE